MKLIILVFIGRLVCLNNEKNDLLEWKSTKDKLLYHSKTDNPAQKTDNVLRETTGSVGYLS